MVLKQCYGNATLAKLQPAFKIQLSYLEMVVTRCNTGLWYFVKADLISKTFWVS